MLSQRIRVYDIKKFKNLSFHPLMFLKYHKSETNLPTCATKQNYTCS